MGRPLVALAGPELPRPQLQHVGPGRSHEQRRGAALRAAPQQPRRSGRQHFGRLQRRHLDEIGDRCAQRRRHFAQRRDRRIGLAFFNLHEHALAHAGERRETVERQRPIAPARANSRRQRGQQPLFGLWRSRHASYLQHIDRRGQYNDRTRGSLRVARCS